MIYTTNKRVGCTPFSNRNVKAREVCKGVMGITQKLDFVKAQVLIGDDEGRYSVGSFVYLRGESARDLWATPMTLNGLEVILVPFEAIVAMEMPP